MAGGLGVFGGVGVAGGLGVFSGVGVAGGLGVVGGVGLVGALAQVGQAPLDPRHTPQPQSLTAPDTVEGSQAAKAQRAVSSVFYMLAGRRILSLTVCLLRLELR